MANGLDLIDHETGCVCFSTEDIESGDIGCVCSKEERVVRARMSGNLSAPLQGSEREAMAKDADYCFKGERVYDELIQLDDVELCRAAFDSWVSMARKHGY